MTFFGPSLVLLLLPLRSELAELDVIVLMLQPVERSSRSVALMVRDSIQRDPANADNAESAAGEPLINYIMSQKEPVIRQPLHRS